jgi:hypothetical protein
MVRLAVENVYGSTNSHLAFVEKRLRRPSDPVISGLIARSYPNCGAAISVRMRDNQGEKVF